MKTEDIITKMKKHFILSKSIQSQRMIISKADFYNLMQFLRQQKIKRKEIIDECFNIIQLKVLPWDVKYVVNTLWEIKKVLEQLKTKPTVVGNIFGMDVAVDERLKDDKFYIEKTKGGNTQ